ncbi:FapA family protein [Serpentinicella sp. ANB-PHB4]|uniref:DUF342 domain-containing protein n=1 Tax=Serpentinicella sp. ANB-PHB4 TaxID=3074076 RepID=UPI00285F7550|nr:FapA family protein [Serpentinicella sp. ANB-PHB4]MDR5658348.1 FapA family protein [Serpentinicella sp. ANB-PHB4]
MEIFKNDYFILSTSDIDVFITIQKTGFDIRQFNDILKEYPQITITNFLTLRHALESERKEPVKIGMLKPKVEVSISKDHMESSVKLNISNKEFINNKKEVLLETVKALRDKEVTYGIMYDVINGSLEPQKEVVVARGVLPTKGENAHVEYIKLPDKKPKIREDESIDFYELDLIHQVHKGDWLGEKIPPKLGTPGRTVTNQELPPKDGKNQILNYDIKTVEEVKEGNKILLRAKVDGAVSFQNGKVTVLDHLIIDGDVGFETGNIEFDGYVTIKGTVSDGFNVVASKDISIKGEIGIGAVGDIHSKTGHVYIQGGVSGKMKAVVKAEKSIFVKYANACTLKATENIEIGFYAIDSKLEAKNVIVNADKGKIIGGTINAKSRVQVQTIGNNFEKKTTINVQGFNRKKLQEELQTLLAEYKECLDKLDQNKRRLRVFEYSLEVSDQSIDMGDYQKHLETNEQLMEMVSKLENKRKVIMDYLEASGEGEVSILKKAYPQTLLEIKNLQKRIDKVTTGTFFVSENKLHYK